MTPSSSTERTAAIERIEGHLASCRRRIRRAELGKLLIEYLLTAAVGIAIVSGMFLAIKLMLALGGSTERAAMFADGAYALTLVVGLTALAAFRVIWPARRLPSAIAAAERLDRAANDHNRVATALWLLGDGYDAESPLALAAIDDGIEYVKRLCDAQPDTTATKRALGRYWPRFTTAGLLCLLCLVAIFNPLPSLRVPLAEAEEAETITTGRIAVVDSPLSSSETDKTQSPRRTDAPAASENGPESTSSKADRSPENTRRPKTNQNSAPNGHGKSAAANRSESGGGTSGQSADGGVSSDSKGKKKPSKTAKESKRKPAASRSTPSDKQKENRPSSSSGGGGSSGGSMRAVQNSWSQQDQATRSEDTEEDDEGEAAEEEEQSNKQRGGIQPSLKDRNQAPSRELGIGEGDGPPGTGRGGPTPPKKSRGTASMVLGVPMPDFVKGRLGPGATKITHEQVTPSPQPGQAAKAGPCEERGLPESTLSRFNVRAGESELVRRYLLNIHSADQRKAKSSPENHSRTTSNKNPSSEKNSQRIQP